MPLLDYRVHQRRLLPPARPHLRAALRPGGRRRRARPDLRGRRRARRAQRGRRTSPAASSRPGPRASRRSPPGTRPTTIQTCREACGGAGYLSENRLGELRADTDVFTTFEGDNTILLQLVAKSLLTGYRDEFGELDAFGTAAFVAGQVWETVVERTAARELIQRLTDDLVPGREREEDLLDREYQLGLFRWREEHILSGAARRLKRGIDDGGDPFEVFNECQDHVLCAARAHTEREILEAFAAAVERCADPSSLSRARRALRPPRPRRDRARSRLVPGARPHLLDPGEGDHPPGQRALRRAASRTPPSWWTPSASRTS